MEQWLRLTKVDKLFNKEDGTSFKALDQIDLALNQDEHLIALIGPDGSGKSTLLKILAGHYAPDAGSYYLTLGPQPVEASDIGYMSQTLGLYEDLSVGTNLELFAKLRDIRVPPDQLSAYLDDLLTQVGLIKFKDYAVGALSGGMKQKLALTCALSAQPKLLLLDEPTVGVDPISRRELWAIIQRYLEQTHSYCIFSSLYLEDQCFKLDLSADHSYQQVARSLMCHLDHSTTLQDLCPRLGRIDLLTKPGTTLEQLKQDLEQLLSLCQPNLSASDYTLSARTPLLEDAYINLSLHGNSPVIIQEPVPEQAETTAPNEVIIDVQGIKKQFGSFTAVHDSNFKVYRGEIFGLLGPNGAGKTTTFRMICALLNPSAGKILIEGMSLSNAKSSVRATIGYVAQKFCLYRNLTVQQNLKYFAQSYGMTGAYLKERLAAMLETFNLKPYLNEIAINLPFGVQRSLSMACALIHEPSILFLDEATSGADPTSRRSFWAMIARLAAQGTTIIVTTHFMEEAEYCDRFLIQDQGQILILGRPDDICGQGPERISIEDAFINCINERRAQQATTVPTDANAPTADSTPTEAHAPTGAAVRAPTEAETSPQGGSHG